MYVYICIYIFPRIEYYPDRRHHLLYGCQGRWRQLQLDLKASMYVSIYICINIGFKGLFIHMNSMQPHFLQIQTRTACTCEGVLNFTDPTPFWLIACLSMRLHVSFSLCLCIVWELP